MKWSSFLLGVFAVFQPARAFAEVPRILATDDVRDCALSADGHVLAATGGGLVVLDAAGHAAVLTALEGLPDTRVERVSVAGREATIETRAGRARLALSDMSVRPLAGAAAPVPVDLVEVLEAPGLPLGTALRATRTGAEKRCFATDRGLFVATGSAAPERVNVSGLPTADVSALARGRDRLFIGSFNQGLFVAHAGNIARVEAGVNPNVNALAWDERAGVLWVGTARGLSRCELAAGGELGCQRVGRSVAVHALLLARDGSLLAGTEQGFSLRSVAGEREFGAKERAPFRAVWSLAESEAGELYLGTTSGVYWAKTGSFTRAAPGLTPRLARASLVSGELLDDWVTALSVAGETLHVGTYNAGLASFRRTASGLEPSESEESLGYVNPAGLLPLAGGRLAVATMDGLRIGVPGNFSTLKTLGRDVTAVVPSERAGEYWVATRRGIERRRLDEPALPAAEGSRQALGTDRPAGGMR